MGYQSWIFMDRISKSRWGSEGVQFGGLTGASLLFTDDAVLMVSSGCDFQRSQVRSGRKEGKHLQIQSHASQLEKMNYLLQVGSELFPQVEEPKYLRALFMSEGKSNHKTDRQIVVAEAIVMDRRGEEEGESEGKALYII